MKFKTVKIDPSTSSNKEWIVTFIKREGDREDIPTEPNDWGFYHYPEYTSDEEAFNTLRDHMVKAHQRQIASLTISVEALKQLMV